MSATLSRADEALLRRVDAACDRFETAWRQGRRPRIEEHWDEAPGPGRALLLQELVLLDVSYRRRGGEQPTPEEYRRRFPGHADVIDVAFPAVASTPPDDLRPHPAGARTPADSNLLFGILALQLDFITRDTLIGAMNAWVLEKATPLGRILVGQGALTDARHALLDALVREHLEQHGDDPRRSLATLSPPARCCRT